MHSSIALTTPLPTWVDKHPTRAPGNELLHMEIFHPFKEVI